MSHKIDSAALNKPHSARLLEPALTCWNALLCGKWPKTVDLLVAYSNRSDLREQLQRAAVILSEEARQDDEPNSDAGGEVRSATRWWSLRDRFSPDDLQTMIDLYKSGTTAKQVAEKFGVSVRSVTRLLHQHGIHRERKAATSPDANNSADRGGVCPCVDRSCWSALCTAMTTTTPTLSTSWDR